MDQPHRIAGHVGINCATVFGCVAADSAVDDFRVREARVNCASGSVGFILIYAASRNQQIAEVHGNCSAGIVGDIPADTTAFDRRFAIGQDGAARHSGIVAQVTVPNNQFPAVTRADGATAISQTVDKRHVVDGELAAYHIEDAKSLATADGESVALDSQCRCDRRQRSIQNNIRTELDGIGAIAGGAGADGLVAIGGEYLIGQAAVG